MNAIKISDVVSVDGGEKHCFSTTVAGGIVSLVLLNGNQPERGSMLNSILVLACHEPVIQLFEEWLGEALMFRPVSCLAECSQISLTYTMKDEPVISGQLLLPAGSLPAMKTRIKCLTDAFELQWGTLPVEIQLSSSRLAPEQLSKLEIGGLYLLEESFRPEWVAAAVIDTESHLRCRVRVEGDRFKVLGDEFRGRADMPQPEPDCIVDDTDSVNVNLTGRIPVPVDYFIAADDKNMLSFGTCLTGSMVALVKNRKILAAGSLSPIGGGYAVIIESIPVK